MTFAPKISIIVPVYNAGKYIRECVSSVQAQTMSDFELILVDDGSTDNSSALCHEMAGTDGRIRVIDIDNSGPAHARNVGIDAAKGEFLAFIDSDDTVSPFFLEKMLISAEKYKADIVICKAYTIYIDGNRKPDAFHFPLNRILTPEEINNFLITGYFIPGKATGLACLWNKLYRKSWIDSIGLRLEETRVRAEDWLFNLQCLLSYPRILAINDTLYNYFVRQESVMRSYRPGEVWQSFESAKILIDANNRIGGNYKDEIMVTCLLSVIDHAIQIHRNHLVKELNELFTSEQLKNVIAEIPLKRLLLLPRAFALTAILLKLHCIWGAITMIKLIDARK